MMQHIQMIHGVLGEDLTHWGPGEVRAASPEFARWLRERKKAKYVSAPSVPAAVEPEPEADETDEAAPKPRKGRRR